MSNKFEERGKSFEKKFVRDEELQFKVQARSNKYIAEFVSQKLAKNKISTIPSYFHNLNLDWLDMRDNPLIIGHYSYKYNCLL